MNETTKQPIPPYQELVKMGDGVYALAEQHGIDTEGRQTLQVASDLNRLRKSRDAGESAGPQTLGDARQLEAAETAQGGGESEAEPAEPAQAPRGPRPGRSETRRSNGRAERIPMGGHRSKLTVEGKDDDYFYRHFIDTGGRIQQAMDAGYELVPRQGVKVGEGEDRNTDLGSAVSTITGRNEDGTPQRSYLMRIRREWYEEDQAAKQAEVDEMDAAIHSGTVDHEPGQDGRYVPKGGIKYHTNRR